MADVEWTAQLLQLTHGQRLATLQRPGTLPVVAACVAAGLLPEEEGEWLSDGWCLLARVRNGLFLAGAHDTQRLPAAADALERLGRMLGYGPPATQDFHQDIARSMRRVRKVHERRFYPQA
jgi:glutamate-ammonia-ligase adenylyltransferase